jgi:hypothetical protein
MFQKTGAFVISCHFGGRDLWIMYVISHIVFEWKYNGKPSSSPVLLAVFLRNLMLIGLHWNFSVVLHSGFCVNLYPQPQICVSPPPPPKRVVIENSRLYWKNYKYMWWRCTDFICNIFLCVSYLIESEGEAMKKMSIKMEEIGEAVGNRYADCSVTIWSAPFRFWCFLNLLLKCRVRIFEE